MKALKKCDDCGKLLRHHNKSGLCAYHQRLKKAREKNNGNFERGKS